LLQLVILESAGSAHEFAVMITFFYIQI